MSGVHVIRNGVVVLYVNTDRLVIDAEGRAVSGVRVELSKHGNALAALNNAHPLPTESVANTHEINTIVRLTEGQA